MPLESGRDIPVTMFIQLVAKIPEGKITCWEDIFDFLGKLYDRKVYDLPNRAMPHIDSENRMIPYWRVVSARGVLGDSRWCSREMQKRQLTEEGIPVIQRGSLENSFRVDNYKEYMFDFSSLKVIRREE